ncbi:hypothetical protein A2U01_0022889, partial [Trifolium medium]|nr:hypothetical protein [Trifolium medium]
EVVIPVKRNKLGRRFGFARFAHVRDEERFGIKLDNIIIGRNKIFVNSPRFQRRKGGTRTTENRNFRDRSAEREKVHAPNLEENNHVKSHTWRERKHRSFAHVVQNVNVDNFELEGKRAAKQTNHVPKQLHYKAEAADLQKLRKAFVGEVQHPGSTYNIQNAFHMEGYFGIKVTPLGANLALLEEQSVGEIEAVMMEGKDWMEQWFRDIRPWNPKEVDTERVVWLRVYGIPAHAWNDNLFTLITSSIGTFLNADDCTSKKINMDVARLMIRTKGLNVVEEFCEVIINGDTFPVRIIEDSNGPMRIALPLKT